MINSRDISELHPILAVLANELIKRMAAKGYPVLITSTYRDFESQTALYAQGRTTSGAIVTNAKAGMSAHNHRLAFDICKNIKGQEYTDATFFSTAGQIGKEIGLEWGGDFTSIQDRPHFQLMFGYSCSSYLAGAKVPEAIKKGCADKRIVKFVQQLLGVDADGIFGTKTQTAVLEHNTTGEVDAATLQKLIDKTTAPKLTVLINGKSVEIAATLINNSWKARTEEITKLIPNDVVSVRTILEAAGYSVEWLNGIVLAKR